MMCVSQVYVYCFSCVCLHMHLDVHFTVMYASTARGHVWTWQVCGCVCEHVPLTLVGFSFRMARGCTHRQIAAAHLQVSILSAHTILPAFRGKKLLTVGNAIKRN